MTSSRRILGAVLAVALSTSTALATVTATFAPGGPTSVNAGTPISADLTIAPSSLTSYDFAFMLIGSEDPVAGLSFTYDSDWTDAFAFVTPPDVDSGEHLGYVHDVLLMSDNVPFGISLSSLAVGTVVIDTTGMAPGTYDIRISNATDGVSELVSIGEGGGVQEPIEGVMNFTILPEPATALIMLLGGVSLLRRVRQ